MSSGKIGSKTRWTTAANGRQIKRRQAATPEEGIAARGIPRRTSLPCVAGELRVVEPVERCERFAAELLQLRQDAPAAAEGEHANLEKLQENPGRLFPFV